MMGYLRAVLLFYMLQYSISCPEIHIPSFSRENCNPTTASSKAFSEILA
jgi:hypothetical protein